MQWTRLGRRAATAAVAVSLLAACAADDKTADDGGSDGGSVTTEPSATGPSPGVTADSIKVGVTYVDTEALVASGLNYDLGDHEAVYTALFDAINEDGGINGRQLEPVFAPIDPTNATSAEEECVKLTEDADVFVITGFFLNDAVACPLGTHETAVVGGGMTPQLIEQAKAPWVTWAPDTDQPEAITREFADRGLLDGKVAVYSATRDQGTLEDNIVPVLEDLGIEPVETGVMDAPADDPAAVQSSVQLIGERFEAADADTILILGASGQDWPTYMNSTSYRPTLLFLDQNAARAFYTNAATTDTSILEGSLQGGGYGPDQPRFDEPAMQECVQTLTDAGLETVAPEDAGDDPSIQPYQAAFQACPDVFLLRALLEAAGENLNYGTLEGAIDGLKVTIPGDPTERTFGPPPDADGNPTAYIYSWDESSKGYVLDEG